MSEENVTCGLCGAVTPSVPEGSPLHAYVPAPAACWATFGAIQADEAERFGYPLPAHRLVVDAYMASHPGRGTDRRDRQSVFVHLRALAARRALGWQEEQVVDLMRGGSGPRVDYPVLTPPSAVAGINVSYMRGSTDLADYTGRASRWADAVWESWAHEHDRVLATLESAHARRLTDTVN